MKKAVVLLGSLLFADINNITTEIKEIESFKPRFKPLVRYDVFDAAKVIKINKKQPTIKAIVVEPKLYLKAIFNKKANINGKWVKVGDEIDGYRVIRVDANGVLLQKFRKRLYLRVKISVIKVAK